MVERIVVVVVGFAQLEMLFSLCNNASASVSSGIFRDVEENGKFLFTVLLQWNRKLCLVF